jgi:hypothetical protein
LGIHTVPKRDHFLLRLNPGVLAALHRWADDELRSTNAQIEYLLVEALKKAGRPRKDVPPDESPTTNRNDTRPEPRP